MRADKTLGIHPVAWEVLRKLEIDARASEVRFEAAAWYNGRERGIVLTAGGFSGRVLHIAVFEHRNDDSICALRWEKDRIDINPPTIASDGKLAYPTDDKYFDIAHREGPDGADAMATWVEGEIEEFLAELKKTSIGSFPRSL